MSDPDPLWYHVDGDLVSQSEATVRVDDRGFRFGDAAFETLRAYGGEVFEWDAHVERLERTCETLAIDHGLDPADLAGRIDETLEANGLADAYVRLSITRGVQPGTLTPQPTVDPTVVVIVDGLPRGGIDGESVWDGPAAVRTVDTRRISDDAIPASAKTHNYLNGILARLELQEWAAEHRNQDGGSASGTGGNAGGESADEAILRAPDGSIAEGATSNVFFVSNGTLYTPSLEGPVLAGVTRRVVCELATDRGLPVDTGAYEPAVLRNADEAFLTNTTWEIRPIESIDGTRLEVGPITRSLIEAFDELVERRCYRSG